jgi:hypothetical protein
LPVSRYMQRSNCIVIRVTSSARTCIRPTASSFGFDARCFDDRPPLIDVHLL